jgi:starvation-inducible outer membrane lipoprotein
LKRSRKSRCGLQGQTVLLAGVIVKTTNTPTGAILEIYQTEMDWEDRPIHTDVQREGFWHNTAIFWTPKFSAKKER